MMRRCTLRLDAAAGVLSRMKALNPDPRRSFEERRFELEMDDHKKHAAVRKSVRVVTNLAADHHDATVALDKSKFGKLAGDGDGQFALTSEELRYWMKAQHAVQILRIDEKKLYGLRAEEIDAAWHNEYALASNARQREEINAAAQVLHQYIGSNLSKEKTLDHYAEHIIQAKKDIQRELDANKQGQTNAMFAGLGVGQLVLSFFFTFSIVAMYRYIEKNDAELAVAKVQRCFVHGMNAPTNDEPAPNYQTRYRDTPTSLDELMAAPHPEITDPKHRAMLLAAEADTRQEEHLLATMTSDVAAEARARAERRAQREKLAQEIQTLSTLDLVDSFVATVPPPGIRELRKA